MTRIPIIGHLLNRGFTKEEVAAIDPGTLRGFEAVLNADPLDQDAVKRFLMAKIFLTSQELCKPKNLWQSILGLFGYDPTEAMSKAMLGISTELYKVMDYDPTEAMREFDEELKRKVNQ